MAIIYSKINDFKVHYLSKTSLVFLLIVISTVNLSPVFADEINHKAIEKNGIKFIYVPPGSFYMGSNITDQKEAKDNKSPRHKVTLTDAYFLSQHEITQKQWVDVMGDNPSRFHGCDNCPVESISWSDASKFIDKLNMQKNSLIVVDAFNFACDDYEIACQVPETPKSQKAGTLELKGYYVVIPFWGDLEGSLSIEVDEKTAQKFTAAVMEEPVDQIEAAAIPPNIAEFCMFATKSMVKDFANIGIDINLIPSSTYQSKILSVNNQIKEAMAFKITGRFGSLSIYFASQRSGHNVGRGRYRLPTEAEWEYAARAGTDSSYYFGSQPENLDKYAWFVKNCPDGKTRPVGLKQPNAWNFYDMQGNVSEWLQDWYEEPLSRTTTNPTGPISGSYKVLKGCNKDSSQEDCRSASRSSDYGGSCSTGLRLLYTAP